LYSVVAGRIERTAISGAIVFVGFGLIFGPLGLGFLTLNVSEDTLKTLVELTLALILFVDAAHADLGVLKRSFRLPQRMLLIAFPLTILFGIGVGVIMFDELALIEIAILATILAPTDAALGKAVITNQSVPADMRECLNVESGLNDGLAVPVLFVFLAIAVGSHHEGRPLIFALELVAKEIGIGLIVGLGLTLLGAWILRQCDRRSWITKTWRQLPVGALAIACFAVAQSIGGSGFIAAFAGGLLFGALAKQHKHDLLHATEGTSDTLALITWVVFGATIVSVAVVPVNWLALVYAALSLTVIRMLPVFLSLAGTGLRVDGKLFLGWFGPRGLASIVFAIIVLNARLPGGDTLAQVVVYTVLLSVIAHGLTANAFSEALGKRMQNGTDA
jgi:NhaP-type Na+/H+ or K+/H+ antiporter